MFIGKRSGLTLTEVLIATAILAGGVVAFIAGFNAIAKTIGTSRARTLASNLAQEKIEKLKSYDYYRIVVTVTPQYDNSFTPATAYDNTYFPMETIKASGFDFKRYTFIQNVQEVNGEIEDVPANTDTGMKRITISVVWLQNGQYKRLQLNNIVSNPNMSMSNSFFKGTITNASNGSPIYDAQIAIIENMGWQDRSDILGKYQINAMQGAYFISVSARGFFSTTRGVTIAANATQTQDFALQPMAAGVINGTAWITDHILISQVVASTTTPDGLFDQEYVELYNPTTNYIKLSTPTINLIYQEYGESPITINLNYVVEGSSIPPFSYYLIANTTTLSVCGSTVAADVVFSTDTVDYPDIIKCPDAGYVGMQQADGGAWVDVVSWYKNYDSAWTLPPGGPWKHTPAQYEGTPILQNAGFTEDEQYIRKASTGGYTAGCPFGSAYDSNNNYIDFIDNVHISIPPKNSAIKAYPIAGTPAIGAIASSNDPMSGPTTAIQKAGGNPNNPPWAEFSLVNVATGTWNIAISSSGYFSQITTATVVANTTTYFPNVESGPLIPATTFHATLLYEKTADGYVSGRVYNAWGTPISPMTLTINGNTYNTSSSGMYFIQADTGTWNLTANPNNANSSYVSLGQDVTIETGQITSGIDFYLSQGGKVRGYVSTNGINPLPGIAINATDVNDVSRAEDVSSSGGYFTLLNLPTGQYTIEPILDSKETSSPSLFTANVTSGCNLFIGTFTVTGAMGTITGSVTSGGKKIITGVLIVATTSTFASDPPAISSATLTMNAIYAASSLEDGTYALEVRGSTNTTYNVYGWFPVIDSNNNATYSRKAQSSVSVTPGTTKSGINLSW